MTSLILFRTDFSWSEQKVVVWLDPEAARAVKNGRTDFEANAATRIANWLGASNWLYRYPHGKDTVTGAALASPTGESYATFAKRVFPVRFGFEDARVVLSMNMEIYQTLSNGRTSWESDFRSFVTTWLSSH